METLLKNEKLKVILISVTFFLVLGFCIYNVVSPKLAYAEALPEKVETRDVKFIRTCIILKCPLLPESKPEQPENPEQLIKQD